MKVLIFVGPSASGKTTIEDKLLNDYDFDRIVLSTSRERRTVLNGFDSDEIEGVHYFFKSTKECLEEESIFKIHITDDWVYSLSKEELKTKIDNEKNLVYSCINSEPAIDLQKSLKDDYGIDAIIVFFDINKKTRHELLINRGDDEMSILKRFSKEENLSLSELEPGLVIRELETSFTDVKSLLNL